MDTIQTLIDSANIFIKYALINDLGKTFDDIITIMANNENNLKEMLSNGITFNFTFKDNFDNKYIQTVTGSGIFNDRITITEPNLVNE